MDIIEDQQTGIGGTETEWKDADARLAAMEQKLDAAPATPPPAAGAGSATTDPQRAAGEVDKGSTNEGTLGVPDAETLKRQAAEKAAAEAKAAAEKAEAEKAKAGEKPKTRFAKEQERLGKTWTEVNAEKEKVRAERAAFEQQRQQWEQERQQREAAAVVTPERYRAAAQHHAQQAAAVIGQAELKAEELEKAGEFDQAEQVRKDAREQAAEARVLARQFEAEAKKAEANPAVRQAAESAQTTAARQAANAEAFKTYAWLNDAESPQFAATKALLDANPDLKQHPKAVLLAARIVAAEHGASRVPSLETENKSLTDEVARLRALTAAPGAGGPAAPPAAKSWEQMTTEEQMASLREGAGNMELSQWRNS